MNLGKISAKYSGVISRPSIQSEVESTLQTTDFNFRYRLPNFTEANTHYLRLWLNGRS